MKEPRWIWALIAVALVVVLISTVRDGGALMVAGPCLVFAGAYAVIQLAMRRGYEWRMARGSGLIMLAVMLVVFLVASSVTQSFELISLFAAAAGAVTLLAVGLKKVA